MSAKSRELMVVIFSECIKFPWEKGHQSYAFYCSERLVRHRNEWQDNEEA
jgi:hypothetical protein